MDASGRHFLRVDLNDRFGVKVRNAEIVGPHLKLDQRGQVGGRQRRRQSQLAADFVHLEFGFEIASNYFVAKSSVGVRIVIDGLFQCNNVSINLNQ